MKRILIAAVVTAVAILAVGLWHRRSWIADMTAQCAAAEPLVRARATREEVARSLGEPSVEYTRLDWSIIEKHFGTAQGGAKVKDIARWLTDGGRVMVYSRSRSIMFLYLDAKTNALHASCFLQ